MLALEVNPQAPVVGVLVGSRAIYDMKSQRTRTQIVHLVQANEEAKVNMYFFDTSAVDFIDNSIQGQYWVSGKKVWKQKKYPFPDVLYIRGGGASKTIDKLVTSIRPRGLIINHPRFDKLNVYNCLLKNAQARDYLPETKIYSGPKDLKSMLRKHGTVYLKPLRGRKGRKVLRVQQLPGSSYRLSYFNETKGKLEMKEDQNFSSVLRELDTVFENTPFLVQQAIDLVTQGDRLVDLRAEVQRNKHGQLEILGVSARVGGSNSPITTHASAVTLDNYLQNICNFPQTSIPGIQEDIRKFLLSVYAGIEECYGEYGEIGIDFGIDKSGRIWYIECNSQSTKVSLEKAYGQDIIYQSFLGVLNYSKYYYIKEHGAKVPPVPTASPAPLATPKPMEPPKPMTKPGPSVAPKVSKDITALKSLPGKEKNFPSMPSGSPETLVFVGVLVRQAIIRKLGNQENVFRLQSLIQANETANTLLFAFSIEDVNFEELTIEGWHFNLQTQLWESETFPFPDVIYNRKGSGGANTKRFWRIAEEMNIKMINPVTDFNKWELYHELSKIDRVKDYLPATVKFRSVKDLRMMLSRYGCIYLKATVGRNGTSIMRLRQTDDGYETSFVNDKVRTMYTHIWNEVVKSVEAFYGKKEYLVQQGIPVYCIGGQNVDMRAELQRNGQGDLEITSISVRMGVKNSPVTSTRTESTVFGLSNFLRTKMRLSDADYKSVIEDINSFLVTVYESVESIYGKFGELGIDFALDAHLKLWLIECNAKSAKVALTLSSDTKTIRQVFLNPLEYAKHIVGSP